MMVAPVYAGLKRFGFGEKMTLVMVLVQNQGNLDHVDKWWPTE